MGFPCPQCGCQYDVGREVSCACGRRLNGDDPRSPAAGPRTARPRFLADAMLGRLARWLRLLGCDVAYDTGLTDTELMARARAERRVLLTRDHGLAQRLRPAEVLVLCSEQVPEQLVQVVRRYGIDWRHRRWTRCTRCNEPLVHASKTEVAHRIPSRVLREHDRFLRCTGCGKVYWRGSHVPRVEARLRALFDRRD